MIGDKLKDLRIAKGLSQTDVADLMGVTKQAIQKYEAGAVKNIPLAQIEKLADVLDTTPAYLVGWESKKPATSAKGNKLMEENIKIFQSLGETEKMVFYFYQEQHI
jgi:transcriptional regulator with XRE-family HTH domain